MKQKHDMEEWLMDRIDEDLMAMADERERLLMESEELQDIEVPQDMLERIYRELDRQNSVARRGRIRRRMIAAMAAAAVLCVGTGLIGYGNRVYEPEIIEVEVGNDTTTKVNNSEAEIREYDEEKVCQEIQEKLGVVPVKLAYQPDGMRLEDYWVKEEAGEAITKYGVGEYKVHIYISKDHDISSINYQTDCVKIDTLVIGSNRLEIEVFEYQNNEEQTYYISSFDYLNTFYSVDGMIEYDEFIKILENIAIKNV